MCDCDLPEDGQFLSLSYENALLLTRSDDLDVVKIGLLVIAETVLKKRTRAQLAHSEIAARLGLPIGRVAAKIRLMETRELVARQSGRGGKGLAEGSSRADFYAPSVPNGHYEENSPARAGPMRKRPEDVCASSGRQGAAPPPTGMGEPGKTIQPDST